MTTYAHRRPGVISFSNEPAEGFEPITDDELRGIVLNGIEDETVRDELSATLESVEAEEAPEPPGLEEIRERHTVKALRALATEHEIVGRSKMNEDDLIAALIDAGAEL